MTLPWGTLATFSRMWSHGSLLVGVITGSLQSIYIYLPEIERSEACYIQVVCDFLSLGAATIFKAMWCKMPRDEEVFLFSLFLSRTLLTPISSRCTYASFTTYDRSDICQRRKLRRRAVRITTCIFREKKCKMFKCKPKRTRCISIWSLYRWNAKLRREA